MNVLSLLYVCTALLFFFMSMSCQKGEGVTCSVVASVEEGNKPRWRPNTCLVDSVQHPDMVAAFGSC